MEVITRTRVDRIIECHNNIHRSMKQALDYALEAGQLLAEQKADMKHGAFLLWIRQQMPFKEKTGEKYMKVFQHRSKIVSSTNLQEAYRQIETIEQQEKLSEKTKQKKRVTSYLHTGEKPDGWKRGTDDKVAHKVTEDLKEHKKRIDKAFLNKQSIEKEKPADDIGGLLEEAAQAIAFQKKHEHLNLSGYAETMTQQAVFSALEKYINTFSTVSEQLEATHNLIKKLKMIVNSLQQESVAVNA